MRVGFGRPICPCHDREGGSDTEDLPVVKGRDADLERACQVDASKGILYLMGGHNSPSERQRDDNKQYAH